MGPHFCANKPSGHYVGRVHRINIRNYRFWGAAVDFVDVDGRRHRLDYEHSRCPSFPGDSELDDVLQASMLDEITDIAADFNAYLNQTGNRFEQMHPDWAAPGVRNPPPYFANEDDDDYDNLGGRLAA